MTTKFQRRWMLFKASITVTLRHRKLLLFPVLTVFLTAVIGLFFVSAITLPLTLHPTGHRFYEPQHWLALGTYYFPPASDQPVAGEPGSKAAEGRDSSAAAHSADANRGNQPNNFRAGPAYRWRYPFGIVIYFASMVLATFFNVAFYNEIIAALNGRGVSFRRGLGVALSRWRPILAWSMLAGAVGWIIRTIAEKLPLAGRIVTGLIGLAWSVAAVFAIPVIIQEKTDWNPIKTLRQSALTLKRTWGEGLIGYVGFSAASMVMVGFSLPILIVVVGLAFYLKSVWLGVGAGVLWVLGLILISYVSNVAGHVYRCALYLYAAEGVVAEPYDSQLLDMAWKVKKA